MATGAGAAGGAGVPKALTAAAATAALNAATSTPNAGNGAATTGVNTGASGSTGAAAQSAAAAAQSVDPAAVSASATGVVAAASGFLGDPDSPSSTDDSTTPIASSVSPGAGGPILAPVAAAAVPISSPAAAAGAQAVSELANVGVTDKHSRDANGDSSLLDNSSDGTAGLAQLSTSASTGTDAAATPTLKVSSAVDTPEFAQGLSERVSYMVDNNLTGAKLQVNPAQLGPIEVRIAVQGNQAQVWLTAHSAVTRDALEASSPKLREMLGAQGFGQVSVDISQRSFQERSTYSQPYDWTPSVGGSKSAVALSSSAASTPRTSSGTLDAYA